MGQRTFSSNALGRFIRSDEPGKEYALRTRGEWAQARQDAQSVGTLAEAHPIIRMNDVASWPIQYVALFLHAQARAALARLSHLGPLILMLAS